MTHVVESLASVGRVGKLHVAVGIRGHEWPLGRGKPAGSANPFVEGVSPDYFAVLRLRLIEGRGFRDCDSVGSPPVVVVDERIAREVFRGRSPLGHCVEFWFDPAAPSVKRPSSACLTGLALSRPA